MDSEDDWFVGGLYRECWVLVMWGGMFVERLEADLDLRDASLW